MVEPHEGVVALRHTFDEVWETLKRMGEMHLQTERKKTPFIAKAEITKRGSHRDERVVRFLRDRSERARSYECCWGRYHNCNRTRIGMYCKALDTGV